LSVPDLPGDGRSDRLELDGDVCEPRGRLPLSEHRCPGSAKEMPGGIFGLARVHEYSEQIFSRTHHPEILKVGGCPSRGGCWE
jgi:hypothetical protein